MTCSYGERTVAEDPMRKISWVVQIVLMAAVLQALVPFPTVSASPTEKSPILGMVEP